jgi:hypothetical protein
MGLAESPLAIGEGAFQERDGLIKLTERRAWFQGKQTGSLTTS